MLPRTRWSRADDDMKSRQLYKSTCNYLVTPHHLLRPRKSLRRASDSPVHTICMRPRNCHRACAMHSFASFAPHGSWVCHTARDTCPHTSGKPALVVPANDCHMRKGFVAAHSGAARPRYGFAITESAGSTTSHTQEGLVTEPLFIRRDHTMNVWWL